MERNFHDPLVIQTTGDLDDLVVTGANVDAEQLQLMLEASPVLRVRNQDGVEIDLYFDMDQESLVAAAVVQ